MSEYRVIEGDCLSVLATLDAESVQTCITSPPYYGLRDYGHAGQIGLEETPEQYVIKLVDVFREVRRVLRDDGTLWLNLGDSYAGGSGMTGRNDTSRETPGGRGGSFQGGPRTALVTHSGLPAKNLLGVPWRVALALQADGWVLRSDIIWAKPNILPESVCDRPTKAHEYLFLLAKSQRYYYDADAIREPHAQVSIDRVPRGRTEGHKWQDGGPGRHTLANDMTQALHPNGRNKRSVWEVATIPYPGAHFATFPPKLIEPCIFAGSRPCDVVLDPFNGAGTTGVVALRHDRNYVGIELNPDYAQMARDRIYDDGPLPNVEAAA